MASVTEPSGESRIPKCTGCTTRIEDHYWGIQVKYCGGFEKFFPKREINDTSPTMEGTVITDLTAKLEALDRQEQGLLCQEEENHLKRRISNKRKAIEDLGQASFKNLPRKIYQRWIQAVLKAELPWTISWLVGMLRLHNQHYLQKTQGPEEMCLSLEHQNLSKTSEKMGFWSRYSFVTKSVYRKPRDWGLARSAYSIKYGKGGNKFGNNFQIPETRMELNEIAWFY